MSTGYSAVLLAIVGVNLLVPASIPGLALSPATLLIVPIYALALRNVFTYERPRLLEPVELALARYPGTTLRRAVTGYLTAALDLAEAMGWTSTFVGTLSLAAATSLPELVVTLSAIPIGALDMAIANQPGGNHFNLVVLAMDYIAYADGPLLSHVSAAHVLTVLIGLLMTGIFTVGLVYRPTAWPARGCAESEPQRHLRRRGNRAAAAEFLARYPQARPDFRFENGHVGLVGEGYDVAIGGGFELSPGVVARAMAPAHIIPVASPGYLAGRTPPVDPAGLSRLEGVVLRSDNTGRTRHWTLRDAAGEEMAEALPGTLAMNDPAVLRQAALAGLGVAMLAVPDVEPQLADGRLVRLVPKWWADAAAISIYYASRAQLPAKTRAFLRGGMTRKSLCPVVTTGRRVRRRPSRREPMRLDIPLISDRRDRILGWSALGGSAIAVFAWAACCVLPIALSFAGVSLAGMALVAGQRTWLTLGAVVVLGVGWWSAWRRRRACETDAGCTPPGRSTLMLLTVATSLTGLALIWQPLVEPSALMLLRSLRG